MGSQLIVLVILILINAFFAASEIAYISLNDAKIEKMAKEGNKKAKQIEKMLVLQMMKEKSSQNY